jgi:hypothetical protein
MRRGRIQRKQRRIMQRRAGKQGLYLRRHGPGSRLVHSIDFAERNGTAADSQQLQDGQVFTRLRHDAVVRRDDQQREIDSTGTGHHRVHQPLMARDVDETQGLTPGHGGVGIAKFYGDSAFFFFLEPVRIDTGQGAHQAGFAVINVTGSADDHRRKALHCIANLV